MTDVKLPISLQEIVPKPVKNVASSETARDSNSEEDSFSSALSNEVEVREPKKSTESIGSEEKVSAKPEQETTPAETENAGATTALQSENVAQLISVVGEGSELADVEAIQNQLTQLLPQQGKELPVAMAPAVASQVQQTAIQDDVKVAAQRVATAATAKVSAVTEGDVESLDVANKQQVKSQTVDVKQQADIGYKGFELAESEVDIESITARRAGLEASGEIFKTNNNVVKADVVQIQNAPALSVQQTNTIKSAMPMTAVNHISAPVQSPEWGQQLGNRMTWMVNNQVQGAEVKLTPPHMGPMEIRISISNDQANVSFTAAHGATREAVESALPRLREMLSENGLNLANVDVSQHSFSEQQAQQDAEAKEGDDLNLDTTDDENMLASMQSLLPQGRQISIGVIDYFA